MSGVLYNPNAGRHRQYANTVNANLKVLIGPILKKRLHVNIQFVIYLLPVVSLDDTSPNGEGSIRKYFCGEETGDITGAHLLLLGEAWFIRGSNSNVLFKVAPQAIAVVCIYKNLKW